jgi:hypothetical protein
MDEKSQEYYELTLIELLGILNRRYTELNDIELKWTKDGGFESCIMNFYDLK